MQYTRYQTTGKRKFFSSFHSYSSFISRSVISDMIPCLYLPEKVRKLKMNIYICMYVYIYIYVIYMCMCVCAQSCLTVTSWTVAHQLLCPWRGLPFPTPGKHPEPGMCLNTHLLNLMHWQVDFFYHCATWEAHIIYTHIYNIIKMYIPGKMA